MRSLSILVVDDDRDNANSLGELFEMDGHRAEVVYTGREAVFAYLKNDFDVAFVDVMMPGMNGVESFMEIRKLRPQANVYMMSGYSVEELLKQALAQGALGLLHKPTDPDTLLRMVKEVGENGLVVAQGIGANFASEISAMANGQGALCHVINKSSGLQHMAPHGELVVMDMNCALIDSMGYYTDLRKSGDMPPTIILAPQAPIQTGREALRDLNVTGILNKPFDPEYLISQLHTLAA
jgi:two-component system, NtrC family, response regulator HydG